MDCPVWSNQIEKLGTPMAVCPRREIHVTYKNRDTLKLHRVLYLFIIFPEKAIVELLLYNIICFEIKVNLESTLFYIIVTYAQEQVEFQLFEKIFVRTIYIFSTSFITHHGTVITKARCCGDANVVGLVNMAQQHNTYYARI